MERIRQENPIQRHKNSLSNVAVLLALNDENGGARRLRKALDLEGAKGSAQWSRLIKELEDINLIEKPTFELLEEVNNELDAFKCVRKNDYLMNKLI